jgi:acetyl esterase/lipase
MLLTVLRALLRATVQRLRQGPSAPSWSWTLEWLIAAYRDALTDSMRFDPARIRALTLRPPGRRPDLALESVELGGAPALRMQVPGASPPRTVLYIHGGGFVVGSPQTHLDLASSIAIGSDACVWSLDYRLAPEHPFPAAPDDVFNAYRALLERGVDPSRLVVAGDSAGGTLTLGLLIQLRQRGLPLPAAAVLISPAPDIALPGKSWESNRRTDYLTREIAAYWIGLYVQRHERSDPALSPIRADLRGLPPLLVQAGSAETLRDDIASLAEALRRASVDVTHSEYADMPHVWHMFRAQLPAARQAIDEIASFVRKHS